MNIRPRHPRPIGIPILIGNEVKFLHKRKAVTGVVWGLRRIGAEMFLFVETDTGTWGPLPIEKLLGHMPQAQ